jgi:hypothetical protein
MKRLIDDQAATKAFLKNRYNIAHDGQGFNPKWFEECMDVLYEPIIEWYDKLDPYDDQTWVLCFVGDDNDKPKTRNMTSWIGDYHEAENFPFRAAGKNPRGFRFWRHATPVNLKIRYKV